MFYWRLVASKKGRSRIFGAMAEETEQAAVIPRSMWIASIVVALQSFSFGYVFSCLNACLVTGTDNNSGSDCYHGTDSSCPDGTMYNDINLSLSKFAVYVSCRTSATDVRFFVQSRHP